VLNDANLSDVSFDFVTPVLAFTAPAANAYVNGTQVMSYTVTETNQTGSTQAKIAAGTLADFVSGSAINTLDGWGAAAEGTVTMTISHTDLADNTGTATRDVTKDVTAPAMTLDLEDTNDDLYVNIAEQAAGFSIRFTGSDANSAAGLDVFFSTTNGLTTRTAVEAADFTSSSPNADGQFGLATSAGNVAIVDGATIYGYMIDEADNVVQAAETLTVDLVAPAFTTLSSWTDNANSLYATIGDNVRLHAATTTEGIYSSIGGGATIKVPQPLVAGDVTVNGNAATTFTDNSGGTNMGGFFDYLVSGGDADGGVTQVINVVDRAGNPVTATIDEDADVINDGDGLRAVIDITKPVVASVTPNLTTIADANVGNETFTLTIVATETNLNTAIKPTITFAQLLTGTLTYDEPNSSWAGNTFTATYDVADGNEDIADIDVIVNGITDLAGNVMDEDATNTDEFSIDNLNPTAVITTSDPLITEADNGGTYTITVTFDEAMNAGVNPTLTFAAKPATLTNLGNTGWSVGNTVFTFTYDIGDSNEEVEDLDFNVTLGQDVAGNVMTQSDATDILDVDQRQPLLTSVTPNIATISDSDVGDATFTLTLDFDEAMHNGVAPSIAFNTDLSASLTLDGTSGWSDFDTYIAVYDVADAGVDVADIDVTVTLAQDAVGNVMAANASNVDEFSIDTENPTVAQVTTAEADGTYGIGSNLDIQIVFSEGVSITGTPQLTYETGTTDRTVSVTDGIDADVFLQAFYTVQEGDNTPDLDYTATNSLVLNGGTIKDQSGNDAVLTLATPGALNSISDDKAIVIDGIRPTVTSINRVTTEITNADDLDFTVTFSESVSGIATGDFAVAGTGTVAGTVNTVSAASGTSVTVNVNGITGDGTLKLNFSGTVADVASNNNSATFSAGQTYTIDNTLPVVTISTPVAAAVVNGSIQPLTYAVVDDNAAASSSADAVNGGNLAVVASTSNLNTLNGWAGADGARTILVSHTDLAGNTGTASVSVTKDETAPVITWTDPAASTRVNSAYAMSFSAAETNPSSFEVQVDGGSWATVTNGATFGSIAAFAAAAEGNVNVAIRHTDLAGNVDTEAARTVIKDFTAPTATITQVSSSPTNADAVSWTVTFSEDVTNFDVSDITVTATGGLNGNVTPAVSATSATVYTVEVTANDNQLDGTVMFTLNTGTNIVDLANNGYVGPNNSSIITIDNTTPKFVSMTLASDNSYVDAVLDQGVYTNPGTGAVVVSDWTLTFSQNIGGNATAASISSVTKTNGTPLTGGETSVRFNLSITGTPSGAETFTIKPATNSSIYNLIGGNMEGTEVSSSVTLNDKLMPAVAITAPAASAIVNGTATLTYTATDLNLGANTLVKAGAGTLTALASGNTLSSVNGFNAAADGNVTITVSNTDTFGNTGSADVTVVKDATNPSLSVTTLAQTETNGTQTVTFTASDANAFTTQASVDNATWTNVATGFAISTAGGWAGLAEGNATLYVRATDAAGNVTTQSQAIVKDVTVPPLTFVPANSATDVALASNLTVTSSSEKLYLISTGIEIANGDLASLITLKKTNSSGADIAYTATVAPSGSGNQITVDPTANLESNEIIYLALNGGLVRDKAGNQITSAQSVTFTTVDNSTTRMAFDALEASVPALSDTQGERVKIATLTVTDDQGGDVDTKPTKITGIVFDQGGDNEVANWTQLFGGIEIERSSTYIAGTINSTNFTFSGLAATNPGDFGYVNDGTSATFNIYAWVKSDIDDAIDDNIDNQYFQIVADYNDVTTAAGGSNMDVTLKASNTTINDTKDPIVVTGSKIASTGLLSNVPSVSSTQAASFEITDANGNRDKVSSTINLTSNSGTSGVSILSGGSVAATNGLASFTVSYTTFGTNVTVTAQSSGLTSVTSNPFSVVANEPANSLTSITGTPFNGQYNIEINFVTNPVGGKGLIVAYQGVESAVNDATNFGDGKAISANVSYSSGTGLTMGNASTGYVVYQGTKPTSNVKIWMLPGTYRFVGYSYDGDKEKSGTVNIKETAPVHSGAITLSKLGEFDAETMENHEGPMFVSPIWPNPVTKGKFSFDMDLDESANVSISLNDLTGRTVYTHTTNQFYFSSGEHTVDVSLDTSKIPTGIYMLYVESELGAYVVPVNIQN